VKVGFPKSAHFTEYTGRPPLELRNCGWILEGLVATRDDNLGTGTGYPLGPGIGTIFYPWVVPVPDPKYRRYVADNFFRSRVTRQVPEKIEIFNFVRLF
jgi:hypothetical protein